MADILIRGVEMPNSCEKCPFNDYEQGFCFAICKFGNSGWPEFSLIVGDMKTRHPNCPLVPLPEGHGRMGDLDALMNNIGDVPYKGAVRRVLMSAPIIIPSEGNSGGS